MACAEPQPHYEDKKRSGKRKKMIADNFEAEQDESDLRGEPSKLRFSCRGNENDEGNIDLKEGSPRRNLQLVLSLQDKNIDLLRNTMQEGGFSI